jgi:D-alanyl-D-alanine carboxypeptidase (penicillin-binding protein 5/6)
MQTIITVRKNQASPARIAIGSLSDVWVSVPNGRYAQLTSSATVYQQISLPLKRGQRVGTLILSLDGHEVSRVALVSLQDIEKAGWFGRMVNVIRGLF